MVTGSQCDVVEVWEVGQDLIIKKYTNLALNAFLTPCVRFWCLSCLDSSGGQ